MRKIRIKASAFAMGYLSSAEKVRELIESMGIASAKPLAYVGSAGIKVTAVQLEIQRYRKLRDYIMDMDSYVAAASAAGSHLVAFPELTGMLAMSLMPGFSSILRTLPQEKFAEALPAVCEAVQGFVGEIFHNTFSQLALAHRIAIAAGGVYQYEGKKLYNRQYLFNEDGEVAGWQNKLFLSAPECAAGVTAGDRLTPAETRFGKVALLCAREAAQYEPFAVAAAMGCALAVVGASPYGEDIAPARWRAQAEPLCVVVPGLIGGEELGLTADTTAAIFAPRVTTRTRDGVVAQYKEGKTLTARLDLARAAQQFDLYCADRNPEFYRTLLG